jgi:hypothetical protein
MADGMALKEEVLRLDALDSRTVPAWIPNTADFDIDLSTNDKQWVGGTGAVSIVDDLLDAREVMQANAKVPPTDLIVGTQVALQFLKEPELRQYWLAGPYQAGVLRSGGLEGGPAIMGATGTNEIAGAKRDAYIGTIAGINIWCSNIHKLSRAIDLESDLEVLIDNKAYLISTRGTLGRLYVFQGMRSWTVPNLRTEVLDFYIKKAMKPTIHRNQNVIIFDNCIA